MHNIETFPKEFLLGATSAAHQVEGDNKNSDWWILEHHPALAGVIVPSGKAIDHFNRYFTDIALMADLGYNSYRFSIEWGSYEHKFGLIAVDRETFVRTPKPSARHLGNYCKMIKFK